MDRREKAPQRAASPVSSSPKLSFLGIHQLSVLSQCFCKSADTRYLTACWEVFPALPVVHEESKQKRGRLFPGVFHIPILVQRKKTIMEVMRRRGCFVQGWKPAQAAMPKLSWQSQTVFSIACSFCVHPNPPPPLQAAMTRHELMCQETPPSQNSWMADGWGCGNVAQREKGTRTCPTCWETPSEQQVNLSAGSLWSRGMRVIWGLSRHLRLLLWEDANPNLEMPMSSP